MRLGGLKRWCVEAGLDRTVATISLARFADAASNGMVLVALPLYMAALPGLPGGLPETLLAGLLIAALGVTNALIQPVAGAASDRLGRHKPFLLAGLALLAATALGYTVARSFSELMAVRLLQGLAIGVTMPVTMALLAAGREKTHGGSLAAHSTLRMAGLAAGPVLGGFLYVRFGFEPVFYTAAGLTAAAVALTACCVREVESTPAPEPRRLFDRRWLTPGVLGAGAATIVVAAAASLIKPLERLFNARLEQTALGFGVALSAMLVGRMLLQFPLGRLSDRIGRKPLIVGGLIVLAVATALMGHADTTLELVGLRALQGFAAAAVTAPAYALAADGAEAGSTGKQISAGPVGYSIGMAIGPVLAGLLVPIHFAAAFWLVGALAVATAWAIHRHVPESVVEISSGPAIGAQADHRGDEDHADACEDGSAARR